MLIYFIFRGFFYIIYINFKHHRETNTLEYVVTGHETPTSIFSGYLSESQQKELDEYEPENLQVFIFKDFIYIIEMLMSISG